MKTSIITILRLCQHFFFIAVLQIVGYGVRLDNYKQFDWNKLTTVIVAQDALEKHGTDFVCYAHQHNARVLIASKFAGLHLLMHILLKILVS